MQPDICTQHLSAAANSQRPQVAAARLHLDGAALPQRPVQQATQGGQVQGCGGGWQRRACPSMVLRSSSGQSSRLPRADRCKGVAVGGSGAPASRWCCAPAAAGPASHPGRTGARVGRWLAAARLHLDGVALLQRPVQQAGRVDDLPAQVLVVHVAHEERLGGERVGLHVHIRARHLCAATAPTI